MVPLVARTLKVKEMRVSSRRAESSAAFVAELAPGVDFAMRAEPDGARAARDADLIITLTESPRPLVFAATVKPGAVVCSMGSYNEVDYGVLREAQRLVVDDAEFAAEMGDGAAWISQGHVSRQAFAKRIDALACEVVAGKKPGRLASSERVVALIQGMAIGDVAFAAHAMRQAESAGTGRVVELP
jgi:ornithine cyclodeaminase